MANPISLDENAIKSANRTKLFNAYKHFMKISNAWPIVDGEPVEPTGAEVKTWIENQMWKGVKANVVVYEQELAAKAAVDGVTEMDD